LPSGKLELRWLRRALHSLDAEAQYIAEFDRVASVKMVKKSMRLSRNSGTTLPWVDQVAFRKHENSL